MRGHHAVGVAIAPATGDRLTQAGGPLRPAVVEKHAVHLFLRQAGQAAYIAKRKTLDPAAPQVDLGVEVVIAHPPFQQSRGYPHESAPFCRKRVPMPYHMKVLQPDPRNHSARSAIIGSTFVACSAGM